MSKILLKQPKDGKYVEYDTDKYTFINKNMSVDDYINISKSRAEQQADKEMSNASTRNFSSILNEFFPFHQTVESFVAELQEFGFCVTEEQMLMLQLKEKEYLEDAAYFGLNSQKRKGC
jgi:hypothetical protein